MPSTDDGRGRAPQSVPIVVGAVGLVLFLAVVGQTSVTTGLPVIVSDLGGLDHLSWVIIAYLLASTVVAPICGKLGDLYGRKVVLQTGIGIFLAGSAVAGFAASMAMLIAARAIQGLGAGALMVTAMTVVADLVPSRQRGRIQGLFAAVIGLSTVVGPLLGGYLVEQVSWHWIFFMNIPLGLVAMVVITVTLRPKGERRRHHIDYFGALLLTGALGTLVLLTSLGGGAYGWSSAPVLGLMALFVALLGSFVLVERRVGEPVLPPALFGNDTFTLCSLIAFLIGFAMFGSATFMPLYLQLVQGASPTSSGLQLLPMMVGMFGSSMLSGQLMSWTGRYRFLPIVSTALLTVGLGFMTTLQPATPVWQVSIYLFLVGVGIGPVLNVAITATQNVTATSLLGVATAGITMFRQIGGSIGVAILGTIFAGRLAAEVARLDVAGVSGMTAGSLSPAMVGGLPSAAREALLSGITNALHPAFGVTVGAGLLAFALSWRIREIPLSTTLRDDGPREAPEPAAN